MSDNHTISFEVGLVIFTIGCGGTILSVKYGDSLIVNLLFLGLIIAGYSLFLYGLVGIVRAKKIKEIFEPLRECLRNHYYDDVAEKFKIKHPIRRDLSGLRLSQLHTDFFHPPFSEGLLSPKKGKTLKGENKLICDDIIELLSLTQDWMRGIPTDGNVNKFHEAMLRAVDEKIKSPLRRYKGAKHYLE